MDRDTGTRWDVPESLIDAVNLSFHSSADKNAAFVLQPQKPEDGTVTGKDRWRQKLLSAMGAGPPVTPRLLPPASCLLPPFFLSPLTSALQPAAVSSLLPVPSSGLSAWGSSGTLVFALFSPCFKLFHVFCDLVQRPCRSGGGGILNLPDATFYSHPNLKANLVLVNNMLISQLIMLMKDYHVCVC